MRGAGSVAKQGAAPAEELLFVPLSDVAPLLQRAASDRGLTDEELQPLAELEEGLDSRAVDKLFDLICRLARTPVPGSV